MHLFVTEVIFKMNSKINRIRKQDILRYGRICYPEFLKLKGSRSICFTERQIKLDVY